MCIDSPMIRVPGRSARMHRVASIPLSLRHADVHDHHVRPQLQCQFDSLSAVLGFADDLHVRLRLEKAAQSVPHDRVIVRDQDPDPGSRGRRRASRTVLLLGRRGGRAFGGRSWRSTGLRRLAATAPAARCTSRPRAHSGSPRGPPGS